MSIKVELYQIMFSKEEVNQLMSHEAILNKAILFISTIKLINLYRNTNRFSKENNTIKNFSNQTKCNKSDGNYL
jgi:hypothetical protein